MYRLVRDTTRFVDGHHVKDLNALNRDLSKVSVKITFFTENNFFIIHIVYYQVIVVDWNSENTKFHPENTLRLPQWIGNDDDTTLYDLAAFLKSTLLVTILINVCFVIYFISYFFLAILATNVEDVREVLNYYRQFENPLQVFRENQRKFLVSITLIYIFIINLILMIKFV